MNAGSMTINWLYSEQLRVDDEWAHRDARGFTWWADQNAQRIEVIRRDTDQELGESFLIRVQTELLSDVTMNERTAKVLSTFMMPFASMSGPVHNTATNQILLSSLVRVHEGSRSWMAPLISMAAVLQVGEARKLGPQLQQLLPRTKLALSGPPGRGLRPSPDEMAEITGNLIFPLGQRPAAWKPTEFKDAVDQHMQAPPSLMATSGGEGLTVEFPFGEASSLCQMKSDEKHPGYGRGLHVRQSFAVRTVDEFSGVQLALELNQQELSEDAAGYGFGSFCYRDEMLHFCSFWPNAIHRPGQLVNLYYSCAARAERMAQRFTGKGWSNKTRRSPRSSGESALGRFFKGFGRRP